MRYSLGFLSSAVAFEQRWDGKLGAETRAYRELLAYAASRILQSGPSVDDVVGYLRELIDEFWTKAEAEVRGDS